MKGRKRDKLFFAMWCLAEMVDAAWRLAVSYVLFWKD